MITLRLLGGAKKAIGKQSVELKTTRASIADILAFLKEIAIEPHLLERANLIIAINGIDSSALGENPIAKEGDTVTIVPVVHGGSKIDCSKNPSSRWQLYSANIRKKTPTNNTRKDSSVVRLNGFYAKIIGLTNHAISEEPARFLETLRSLSPKSVAIQAINADFAFSRDYLLQIIGMVLEAKARNIMIANKLEVELLLRIALTFQISDAITKAGIVSSKPICLIAISKSEPELEEFSYLVGTKLGLDIDASVLKATRAKMLRLMRANSWKENEVINSKTFTDFLVERAAIMIQG